MKKSIISILIAGIAVVTLAGCGANYAEDAEDTSANEGIKRATVEFEDDSIVNCLYSFSSNLLSFECDWDGAGPTYKASKEDKERVSLTPSIEEINGRDVRCILVSASEDRGELICDL